MYICNKCHELFNTPVIEDFEDIYKNDEERFCPICGALDIEKLNEDEDD